MLTGEIFATPREPDSVTPNSSLINQLPALHNDVGASIWVGRK